VRKRIAGTGAALVLAITFGVMGATGVGLAVGDTSTAATMTATPAETQAATVPLAGGRVRRLHIRPSIQSATRWLPPAYGRELA
jgi:hypothetical protein